MSTRLGIIVECENGILKGGRGGMVALEPDGKTVIKRFPGDGGKTHQRNFVDAVKANDASVLRSTIQTASTSALLAHYANISHRMGEMASSKEIMRQFGDHADLAQIIQEQEGQLLNWGLSEPQYHLGKALRIDPSKQTLITSGVDEAMSGPNYRKGFELPTLT